VNSCESELPVGNMGVVARLDVELENQHTDRHSRW
jgi:hypothetical protein